MLFLFNSETLILLSTFSFYTTITESAILQKTATIPLSCFKIEKQHSVFYFFSQKKTASND